MWPTGEGLLLEVASGPDSRRAIRVAAGRTVRVGRQAGAEVVIAADTALSRLHFAIVWKGGRPFAEDLGSANGTMVNGSPIRVCELADGDEITAGATLFRIRLPPRPAAAPEPSPGPVAVERTVLMPRREGPGPGTPSAPPASSTGPIARGEPHGAGGAAAAGPPLAAAEVQESDLPPVMAVRNHTRFAVATLLWEDARGRPGLTVVIKGTFCVAPGDNPRFCATPLPVFSADQHTGGDPLASVRFESDLVPYKPRADVVLVGKAHAPAGQPVTQIDVALRVGGFSGVIRVFGDRRWAYVRETGTLVATTPLPFATMDLTYERAFGGFDRAASAHCAENPVGRGFFGRDPGASADGRPLPNLEDPANLILSWRSQPRPVGFGFYGRGWQPRLRYAGTYDDQYRAHRAPAPPDDFSYAFFCGANPALQVAGELRGDEPVELVNLSPEPRVQFSLPGLRPELVISRRAQPRPDTDDAAGEGEATAPVRLARDGVPVRLDTLVLVPDQGMFYEVFRGVCPLRALDPSEVAEITIRYAQPP
jgi:hypothetical protein